MPMSTQSFGVRSNEVREGVRKSVDISDSECDAAGRVPGAIVPDLDEALAHLRELAQTNE